MDDTPPNFRWHSEAAGYANWAPLPGLTRGTSIQPQSDLRSVETVGFRPENFGAEKAGPGVHPEANGID